MDTQPENTPRKGRARDRYERRRNRGMVQPSTGRSVPRQLSPAGSFKMPEIRLPQSRMILYGVGAIGFALAVVVLLGLLKNDPVEVGPNALWIGPEWTYEASDDAALDAFVERLRENQIGVLYAWVTELQADGTWRGTASFEAVKTFAERFKRAYPESELYGWVRIPVQADRLASSASQQTIADFSGRVIAEFGFDGVMLNAEPVLNNNADDFLELLRKVRSAIPDDNLLSVSVPPDWTPVDADIPVPPMIAPGTVWDEDFKRRVAILADQMVLTAYSGGLTSPDDYAAWVAYQVETFAAALADPETGTDLIIGIPTYAPELPGHDPRIENVTSAIEGIRTGMAQAGESARFVTGVAVYAEWETDDSEWAQFKIEWVDG
jgi:hypothetical protein